MPSVVLLSLFKEDVAPGVDLVLSGAAREPPPVGKPMFLSPNLDHMLLEHIEGGKLHHFKAELDGRCPGVPTEGPVRV